MRRSAPRLVLRSLTAGVALAALGLAVASPASAHTTNIYTFGYTEDSANFATVDRTTAVTAPLATNIEAAIDDVGGVEVFNEVGTAIGYDYDEPTVSSVLACRSSSAPRSSCRRSISPEARAARIMHREPSR